MNDPEKDGYVECDECGHIIETSHDEDGCMMVGCSCAEGFTQRDMGDIRARYGLPRRFDYYEI